MDKIAPYFSFQNRANRQRYWLTSLAIYGLLLVALFVAITLPGIGWAIGGIGGVAWLWVALATAIRRLHDRGKSGWWLAPMYGPVILISGLAGLIGATGDSEDVANGLKALSLPFSLWAFIELGCLKGTVGDNRFGPDPLAPRSPAEVFA